MDVFAKWIGYNGLFLVPHGSFFFLTRFCSAFQRKVYFIVKGYIACFPELHSGIRPDRILTDFRLIPLATIFKLCSLSSSEQ